MQTDQKEFKKILFPIDFSEPTKKIIPYVLTMADKFGAEVHLLFVSSTLEHFKSIYVPHPAVNSFEKEVAEGAQRKIDEYTEDNFPPKKQPIKAVRIGDPADEIVKYIEEQGIDLAIVGTHARKGLERIIYGSVARSVFERSKIPIMIINPYLL